MANDLRVLPPDDDPPVRYRLSINVTGPGFDIDVSVDGLPVLGPGLQQAVLAVVEAACSDDEEGDED